MFRCPAHQVANQTVSPPPFETSWCFKLFMAFFFVHPPFFSFVSMFDSSQVLENNISWLLRWVRLCRSLPAGPFSNGGALRKKVTRGPVYAFQALHRRVSLRVLGLRCGAEILLFKFVGKERPSHVPPSPSLILRLPLRQTGRCPCLRRTHVLAIHDTIAFADMADPIASRLPYTAAVALHILRFAPLSFCRPVSAVRLTRRLKLGAKSTTLQ